MNHISLSSYFCSASSWRQPRVTCTNESTYGAAEQSDTSLGLNAAFQNHFPLLLQPREHLSTTPEAKHIDPQVKKWPVEELGRRRQGKVGKLMDWFSLYQVWLTLRVLTAEHSGLSSMIYYPQVQLLQGFMAMNPPGSFQAAGTTIGSFQTDSTKTPPLLSGGAWQSLVWHRIIIAVLHSAALPQIRKITDIVSGNREALL